MKKFLVVLTILVLVAGFAFADISGSVEAGFAVAVTDVADDKSLDVKYSADDTAHVDATFTLDEQTAPVLGEGSVYVDFAITATIDGRYSYNADHWDAPKTINALAFDLSVEKFDIVGEGWKLNLISSKKAASDFAKSAIDSQLFNYLTIEQGYGAYTYKNSFDYAPGVTLTYKDYVVGVGLTRDTSVSKYVNASFEVKTPEFAFGDVKVQAAAGVSQKAPVAKADDTVEIVVLTNNDIDAIIEVGAVTGVSYRLIGGDSALFAPLPVAGKEGTYEVKTAGAAAKALTRKAGGSFKVAYETEDVVASFAIDAGKVSGKDVDFDLAANLQVKPVTVDVYYASNAAAYNPKKATEAHVIKLTKVLSAKVAFALGDLVENVPVTVTVTGKDLLKNNGAYETLDVAVNTTAIKDFDITVTAGELRDKAALYGEVDVKYTGVENLELEADASYVFDSKLFGLELDAKYTAEKYTAEGNAAVITDFTNAIVTFGASVESNAIVNGATLKAAVSGLDFGKDVDAKHTLAVTLITLSAKVEF
jgi:hypothetical protein